MSTKAILMWCFIGATFALPMQKPNYVTIVRNERQQHADGSYKFFYETSDGQKRMEMGTMVNEKGMEPFLMVVGEFSYVGPDGVTYSTRYSANKNGFLPSGNHIPGSSFSMKPFPMKPTIKPPILMKPMTFRPPTAPPPHTINSLIG